MHRVEMAWLLEERLAEFHRRFDAEIARDLAGLPNNDALADVVKMRVRDLAIECKLSFDIVEVSQNGTGLQVLYNGISLTDHEHVVYMVED